MNIRPVILSGGSGTRLWPVSRKRHPKQFAKLIGNHSLLVATLETLQAKADFMPAALVAQNDHKFFVLDAIDQMQQMMGTILLEPCGRNTAAAALIAALAETDENCLHLLLPSDHVIKDRNAFFKAIGTAAKAAESQCIALFGIAPTSPETGYGYISSGAATPWDTVKKIASFREKPDAETAMTLITGGALWNSGIFMYDPKLLIEECERYAPEHVRLCRTALEAAKTDLGCCELAKESYARLQNVSLDCLIMEKTERGVVVPCDMQWSDAGSWQSLWQLEDKDNNGNVTHGPVVTMDVRNSYIHSSGHVVGIIGLDDIVVVATDDAILVASRARSQDVKGLVGLLEKQAQHVSIEHRHVMRPWGFYESVAQGERFQIKHIVVRPGQSLSLQMHHHRAEHWVVVTGTAQVECDGKIRSVYENESVYMPKGSQHRLSNPGKIDLHLVEVQSGEYLGEDDIVRFSDKYGRVGAVVKTGFTETAISSTPVTRSKEKI